MQSSLILQSPAFHNRLSDRHPAEKLAFSAGFLVLVFLLRSLPWSLVIAGLISIAAVCVAGLALRVWLRALAAPVLFVLFSSLALLFELKISPSGWTLHWAGDGFRIAASLFARSTAGVCAMAFLGLTTPVMDLLSLLARIGLPRPFVDLAALVYRFLLISVRTLTEMRQSQTWRMGRAGWRAQLRAAAMLTSALFVRCMERAKHLEEGLAGRGYSGALHLLTPHRDPSKTLIISVLTLQALFLLVACVTEAGEVWTRP